MTVDTRAACIALYVDARTDACVDATNRDGLARLRAETEKTAKNTPATRLADANATTPTTAAGFDPATSRFGAGRAGSASATARRGSIESPGGATSRGTPSRGGCSSRSSPRRCWEEKAEEEEEEEEEEVEEGTGSFTAEEGSRTTPSRARATRCSSGRRGTRWSGSTRSFLDPTAPTTRRRRRKKRFRRDDSPKRSGSTYRGSRSRARIHERGPVE